MTVLAGIIGFIVIWYLMGLITEKFSTGPAPAPPPQQSRPEWADVLGVAPDASRDDVKRTYLQKIEEFAPGRLAALGPEMRKPPRSGCSRSISPSMPPSGGSPGDSPE